MTRMTTTRHTGSPKCPRCEAPVALFQRGGVKPHRDPITRAMCPIRFISLLAAEDVVNEARVKVGLAKKVWL